MLALKKYMENQGTSPPIWGSTLPDYLSVGDVFTSEETHDMGKAMSLLCRAREDNPDILGVFVAWIQHLFLDREVHRFIDNYIASLIPKIGERMGHNLIEAIVDHYIAIPRNGITQEMIYKESEKLDNTIGDISYCLADVFKREYPLVEEAMLQIRKNPILLEPTSRNITSFIESERELAEGILEESGLDDDSKREAFLNYIVEEANKNTIRQINYPQIISHSPQDDPREGEAPQASPQPFPQERSVGVFQPGWAPQ